MPQPTFEASLLRARNRRITSSEQITGHFRVSEGRGGNVYLDLILPTGLVERWEIEDDQAHPVSWSDEIPAVELLQSLEPSEKGDSYVAGDR